MHLSLLEIKSNFSHKMKNCLKAGFSACEIILTLKRGYFQEHSLNCLVKVGWGRKQLIIILTQQRGHSFYSEVLVFG